MLKVRFTIGRLLGLIALIAFGLAAYRQASEVSVSLSSYLVLAILLYGSLQARFASGSHADWWFGFALLGGGHLFIGWGVNTPIISIEDLADWAFHDPEPTNASYSRELCEEMIVHNLFSLVVGWLGGWGVVWYAARVRRRSAGAPTTSSDD